MIKINVNRKMAVKFNLGKNRYILSVLLLILITYFVYVYSNDFITSPVEPRLTSAFLSHIHHEKWIVITSINKPTSDIKKLSLLKGWVVLVVGDTKSPTNWSYPNCIFLDIETQKKLGYETTKLIKYRSYARKNIGYLFAIQHGAKLIYDTDDDNSPTTENIGFDPFLNETYLSYHDESSHNVANPYAHFGQSSIWPRGYPLDKISYNPTRTYNKCKSKSVFVQQGVVNGDPDVDAIFRLTRKDESVDLKINFDSKASPLMYPKGMMAPYNSQNTLHLRNAFWGLLLPQTVAFRVCDIWRSYWAQRLLWDIGGHIGFFPPNAYTYRNAHSYLADFIDEQELYHKSSSLVNFLTKWRSTTRTFFERVMELSIEMQVQGFWKIDDVYLVRSWLKDLIAIGYKPPQLDNKDSTTVCSDEIITQYPDEQPSSYLGLKTEVKNIIPSPKK